MNADSFFSIGTTHQVCQDYARSGKFNDNPYVIISDGCSTAVDSDFGCRLIAKSAEVNISEPDVEMFLKKTLNEVLEFSDKINLHPDSLCATLLVARVIEDKLQVVIVGDGAFVIDAPTTKTFWNIHFNSGAPYYLRYELNEKIKNDYFEKFPPVGKIEKTGLLHGVDDVVEDFELKKGSLKDIAFVYEWDAKTINNITLFSDGINSFMEKELTITSKFGHSINAIEIAEEFTNFKNFAGQFVQRRCKRALKDFGNKNWSHFDDLSVASIRMVS